MTPLEIEAQARNKYNSTGDAFYASSEIMHLIYEACMELANECQIIERTYSTTTVSGTQEYAYPTNTIAIKRITYNGTKLMPMSMREDDVLTLLNQATTTTGTPTNYFIWNESVFLRPIPDAAQTLKIFSFNEPQSVTSSSTLEVPTQYHPDIVNYVVAEMCAKDENTGLATYYANKWQTAVARAKRANQKKKRGDSFAAVQDYEVLPESFLGTT